MSERQKEKEFFPSELEMLVAFATFVDFYKF